MAKALCHCGPVTSPASLLVKVIHSAPKTEPGSKYIWMNFESRPSINLSDLQNRLLPFQIWNPNPGLTSSHQESISTGRVLLGSVLGSLLGCLLDSVSNLLLDCLVDLQDNRRVDSRNENLGLFVPVLVSPR